MSEEVTIPLNAMVTGIGLITAIAGAFYTARTQIVKLEESHREKSEATKAEIANLRAEMTKGFDDLRRDTVGKREYDVQIASMSLQFTQILDGQSRIERRLDRVFDQGSSQ